MKQKTFHKRPAVCALLAAALLLPGCGAADSAPASSAASTAQSGIIQTAPAYQDDGRLRLLYGNDYGSALPFRGVEPLSVPDGSSSVFLLTDLLTGERTHYAVNTPQGDQPYQYRVYDSTGTLVYYCGEERPFNLLGDWLLLSEAYDGVDVSYELSCRMLDLKTGESRPLPGNSAAFEPLDTGGYLLTGWGEDQIPFSYLYDSEMNQTAFFENGYLVTPYLYDACGWLELNRQAETPSGGYAFETSLYDPVTGRELTNYVALVGNGVACLKQDNGSYSLYDLAAGVELASGWQQYLLYHSGIVMTRQQDGRMLQDNEGLFYPVEDYDMAEDGTLVVRSTNHTVTRVYSPEGSLLYSQSKIDGNLSALSGGRFLVTIYNWQSPQRNQSTLYGPAGILFQTEQGSYITQRTDNYLVVTRLSYADSYRYDIYDYEGNLLVGSLAGLPGTLEDDLLPARRGFTIGWMDLEGNWLWSQRMFTSTNDERDYTMY